MEDKPKTALDWIRWGAEQKRQSEVAAPAPSERPIAPLPPASEDEEPALQDLMRRSPEPEPTPVEPWVEGVEEPIAEAPAEAAIELPPGIEEVEEDDAIDPIDDLDDLNDIDDLEDLEDLGDFEDVEDVDEAGNVEDLDEAEPAVEEPEPTVAEQAPTEAAPTEAWAPPPAPQRAPEPTPEPTPPSPAEPRTPAAANSTIVIPEGTAYRFSVEDFHFEEGDGPTITQLKIVSLAGVGAMTLGHEQVFLGQRISRSDLEARLFVFLPGTSGPNASHDTFLFKVSDGETWSRVAYTMTVQTTPTDD